MPPPRRGWGGGGIKQWSASVICLSICLSVMSRTSALTRKPKGLGRRNCAQGYPRSHATPTPTSRSKGQKSRWGGGILWRPRSRTACYKWVVGIFWSSSVSKYALIVWNVMSYWWERCPFTAVLSRCDLCKSLLTSGTASLWNLSSASERIALYSSVTDPAYLHLATSEMWCWSGGRGI